MKKKMILFSLLAWTVFQVNAQDRRSGILEGKEQSIGVATGLDYSILPIQLTYQRGVTLRNLKYPVMLGVDVTVPLFDLDLLDSRIRLTSETTILRKRNFEIRGGIDPVFVNVKMETERMASIGADAHFFMGLVSEKWNFGLEGNYNQIFSTHIVHTDKYKENVYAAAVDGWYKNTASNWRAGILANRTLGRVDVFFHGGLSTTGKFNAYLFVPTMYMLVGVNRRF